MTTAAPVDSTAAVSTKPTTAPTGKGTRVPKPDQQAHRRQVDDLSNQIKDLQAKQAKIQEEFTKLKTEGEGGQKRQELRQKLDELKKQQATHRESRGKVLDALKYAQESQKKRLDEIKSARDKLPYKSVAEIDRRIAELEQLVASATLKLVEEKRTLSDITALRKHRKALDSFDPQEEAIQQDKKKIEELRSKLEQFDPENKRLQKEFGEVLGQLRAMDSSKEELNSKYKKINTERDEVKKQLDGLFERRRQLNEEFKKANNDWFESQREERARRAEQMKKEREEADRLRKLEQIRKAREAAELPAFEQEINTCNVLVQLLQQYTGEEVVNTEAIQVEKPKAANLRTVSAEDNQALPKGVKGAVMLKKKSDRFDEDNLFGGSGTGKKKATKSQSANREKENLKFDLDLMNQFVNLKIKIPTKVAEVPDAITALQEKKKYYVENQERVTKENIQKAKALEEKIMNELETKPVPETVDEPEA